MAIYIIFNSVQYSSVQYHYTEYLQLHKMFSKNPKPCVLISDINQLNRESPSLSIRLTKDTTYLHYQWNIIITFDHTIAVEINICLVIQLHKQPILLQNLLHKYYKSISSSASQNLHVVKTNIWLSKAIAVCLSRPHHKCIISILHESKQVL